MAVEPGQLDGRFVGLRAGITKKGLGHARQFAQALGELLLQRNAVEIRRMDEGMGLRRNGVGHRGVRMA